MKTGKSNNYGFKKITVSNWKWADEILQWPYIVPEEVWVTACLKPELDAAVPEEIHEIFEVARGSLIYGWFFYPLITLAAEQTHRVLEAGARERCRQLGLLTNTRTRSGIAREKSFSEIIANLATSKVLTKTDLVRWQAARRLRNAASHPARQSILSTDMAISCLKSTVELLNRLFK
jgi:hypothetical protein